MIIFLNKIMNSSYFLKRAGILSNRFLSHSAIFNFFLKPLVFLDVRALEKSQYWPQEKIKEIQWSRVKNILDIAYKQNTFWAKQFDRVEVRPEGIKNWSDFEKLPIVKKDDIRGKDFYEIVSSHIPKHWLYKDDTSGSTGVPFRFVVDRGFVMRGLAFCQRMFRMSGQQKGDTFVRLSATDRPGLNFGNYFFKVPAYYDEFERRAEDFIKKYNGQNLVIYGVASYLIELAKTLSKKNHNVSFRAAIASGEAMSDIQKKFVQDRLKCPVSRCYATRELGVIAQDCLLGGLHINTEWAYLEIVDDDGLVLAPGQEGRIVVTTFDNEIMPFIRYDTADIGKILLQSCLCGRTLPLIKFSGRKVGLLHLPKGRTIHHFYLTPSFHLRADRIKRFQIIQESVNRILVKILPDKNFFYADILTITEELSRVLGPDVILNLQLVDSIPAGPRGKAATFESKLNL